MERRNSKDENTQKVGDGYDIHEFDIIILEGCEFYELTGNRIYGLTKVDCNCIPDKSKRKKI
jgi:hypothetical protein